ncbi:MAG: zinc ribbon domain-containing protein, partial [Myxococcales bacterium]|nr:zinc ribbon domain-containing protein [Myxococcales bacterium]
MVKCPNCGRENDDSFRFCLDCGNVLRPGATSEKPAPAGPPPSPAEQPAPAPRPSRPATGAQARPASAIRPAAPPPTA